MHSPDATLVLTKPEPFAPVPLATINTHSIVIPLVNNPDCALPTSFDYCGTTFSESSCTPSGVTYAGTCTNATGSIPSGCYGNPLFRLLAAITEYSIGNQILIAAISSTSAIVAFILVAVFSRI